MDPPERALAGRGCTPDPISFACLRRLLTQKFRPAPMSWERANVGFLN